MHWHLPFFSFIRQENWSAGFHKQAQIPFPSNIYEEYASRPQATGPFPTAWPFLVSFPSCIKPIHCGCKTVMHFSVAENKRTSMSAHLTWKPLMILSLGRVAVAKWLFCVRLSHLPILINPQDCLFAVTVTCWYRERTANWWWIQKKISFPSIPMRFFFKIPACSAKMPFLSNSVQCWVLKMLLSLKQDKNIHRGRFTGAPVHTVGLQ